MSYFIHNPKKVRVNLTSMYCTVFFILRFKGCRKDEVLGVANNRLIRIDLNVDEVVKTWRYNTMRQWNVNWDIKQVCCSVSNIILFFFRKY